MLADYAGNYHGYQVDPQVGSAGQQQRIIILWDLLKTRLRKSEVEEMARMIGSELIDNLEGLRLELENLIQINKDLREERNERAGGDTVADSKSMMSESQVNGATSSIFSETKNASFLNQELLFFIDNLHQKATDSGLPEDALIPQGSSKDKKIYQQLRPQSKLGRPKSAIQKDGNRLSDRENSPAHTAMRSSFYSMSMMGDLNIETAEEENKEMVRFQQEQASRGAMVNKVNFKNILELSQTEQELLAEIKKFMNVQVGELQTEIESMQKLMLEQAAAVASQDQSEQEEEEVVTQKDLKQYTEKLKDEFLHSDHVVKIATLPSASSSSQTKRMNTTGNSFTSYLNKYKPLPVVSGASFKPAVIGLGALKQPIGSIKLKTQTSMEQQLPQSRSSIGKINQQIPTVAPLKAQLSARGNESARGPDSARGGQLSARGVAFAQNAVQVYKEIREQNPKGLDSTPTKTKPKQSSNQKEPNSEKRSNSVVKKIKIKRKDSRDRLAAGRQAVKSSQQTASPKEEKRVSPGGTITVIPINQIKYERKEDLFTNPTRDDAPQTAIPGSSSGFSAQKKIKLAKKRTAPLTSNLPVEEPRIIDTTKSSGFRHGSPKQQESENLYGLDISILKSLNMDHLLEEKKAQQEQNTSKENWYLQNKDMEELRKEHSMLPTTKGGANRLRARCAYYKNDEDNAKVEDSN